MKIQSMFQKDINRDINGVVKVAQDDEKSLTLSGSYKRGGICSGRSRFAVE